MGWQDVAALGDVLPAVFVHSLVTNRLRNDPEFDERRICSRIVDVTRNTALSHRRTPDTAQARHDTKSTRIPPQVGETRTATDRGTGRDRANER
jgi:hypothetical protein